VFDRETAMALEDSAPFYPLTPSEEQQDALRMILMYYEDKARHVIDDIKSRVDNIITRYNISDYVSTESTEKHRAIFYGRKTVTKRVLEKNYAIFRYALAEWLIASKATVPSLLMAAMHTIGLAPEDAFIDRKFVETSFLQRASGSVARAGDAARRIVLEHEGFWLVYRLSTLHALQETERRPHAADPAVNIGDRIINLSLLRICNDAYLTDADRLSPRFTFEFRGDEGRNPTVRRTQGYLVPSGDHLFLIGRRIWPSLPTITVMSWPIADFDLDRRGHADNIKGLAYAANADGKQVAFYFVAKFIRESANLGFKGAFQDVCQIYQRLIRAYHYDNLNAEVTAAYEEARHSCHSAGVDLQAAHLPPILNEVDLNGLITRSQNDVVFREG
jgi:hypothetical protein